jgi:hypothetical protein
MIDGVFYIEAQGNNEAVVKKSLGDLVEKMKAQKGVEVEDAPFGETAKENGNYSLTVDVDVSFDSLKDYFMAAMKFGPSAITVESPKKIKLSTKEFLEIAGDITALTKTVKDKYGISFTFPEPEAEISVGLKEDEIDALLDQGALRVKLVVESQDGKEEAVNKFIQAIGREVFIHKVKASSLKDRTLVAVHVFMYEPKTLIDISIKHSPVLIEILEPDEITLSMFEIQDIGVELAATYFEMAHISLNRPSPS